MEEKKKPHYRPLKPKEQDMLFAFYDKWNGNVSEMILDTDCIFKSRNQIYYYRDLYNFKEQLVQIRANRAKEVMKLLPDAKIKALENAIRLLEPSHHIAYNKAGLQVFDLDGNPLIIEKLPYYKEIKVAWEIIKAELGESIYKFEHSGDLSLEISKLEKVVDDIVSR
jgi:hypothetical protein